MFYLFFPLKNTQIILISVDKDNNNNNNNNE